MKNVFITILMLCFATSAFAQESYVNGFSLTEIGDEIYDATKSGEKTNAQKMVDKLFNLGVRRINLSPRAVMTDPRSNEVIPRIIFNNRTNPARVSQERRGYINLIKYIKAKGMTVGMRPIFFVIDENGQTPVRETLSDGTIKTWWH
jgi:hypothetical protein